MQRARVAPLIFIAILLARLLVLLVSFQMDGKNAYFEAALAAIPPPESEVSLQKRLGFIEVLGNLPDAKIFKIFGTPSEELKTAIDLATAITDGDLQKNRTNRSSKTKENQSGGANQGYFDFK